MADDREKALRVLAVLTVQKHVEEQEWLEILDYLVGTNEESRRTILKALAQPPYRELIQSHAREFRCGR